MRAFRRRLLAAVTHSGPGYQPTPIPAHDDDVYAWLKTQRDQFADQYGPTPEWYAVDRVLNRYRLHADSHTPLGEDLQTEVPW